MSESQLAHLVGIILVCDSAVGIILKDKTVYKDVVESTFLARISSDLLGINFLLF